MDQGKEKSKQGVSTEPGRRGNTLLFIAPYIGRKEIIGAD